TSAAARTYESGGFFDLALDLYWKHGQHLAAGNLLRRMGELERAQGEYRLAAKKMISTGRGYDDAGEMLLTDAQWPELALEYFETGWKERPDPSCVSCAVRLVQLYTRQEVPRKVEKLLGEGEEYFNLRGADKEAALFFTEIAKAADT